MLLGGLFPKPFLQVQRLGSWGRVCPKLSFGAPGADFWGEAAAPREVQEPDRAPNSARSPLVPLHPAVATKPLISLFLK